MGQPVEFEGMVRTFGPPPGREEEIGHLPVFGNGYSVVSCWQLSEEELADIIANDRKLFVSVLSGAQVYPLFVGSEREVASVVADTGKIWKKG